jgi:hypothetical protein
VGYHINSISPSAIYFLTAEYRIRKVLPASNVTSSSLSSALSWIGGGWAKVEEGMGRLRRGKGGKGCGGMRRDAEGILCKPDIPSITGSPYNPTKHRFIHIRFLNHFLVP